MTTLLGMLMPCRIPETLLVRPASPISNLQSQIPPSYMACVLFLFLLLAPVARGAELPEPSAPVASASPRFMAVDVVMDSGAEFLAAYQVTFMVTNLQAKIVGIEGGDPLPFREPPYYDPKAIQHERVILAAFSTAPANQLSRGRTRVATIHLQVAGAGEPACTLTVQAAADATGRPVSVQATAQPRNKP